MSDFINLALMAAQTGTGGGTPFNPIFLLLALMFMFYFIVFRPQQTEKKERKKMIEALKVNDRIVTIGGLHGVVKEIKDSKQTVIVQVDKNTRLEFNRSSVLQVDPKDKGDSGGDDKDSSGKSGDKSTSKKK